MNYKTTTAADIAFPALMTATVVAANKRRDRKRQGAMGTPYINHPLMVVNLMANVGWITGIESLQPACRISSRRRPVNKLSARRRE